MTLTAGQVGDMTDSTTQLITTDDLAPDTEWASGRIMFRHTPLAKVLQTVSQWYGYQFRYADQALGAQSVTMIVSTRSSAEALAAIEQVLAVNLTVVGDTVTLVPRPPQSSRSTPRIRTYDVWTPTREVGR
jgi:ferric-dicitrate binding protein FerR (iron transport regulator)